MSDFEQIKRNWFNEKKTPITEDKTGSLCAKVRCKVCGFIEDSQAKHTKKELLEMIGKGTVLMTIIRNCDNCGYTAVFEVLGFYIEMEKEDESEKQMD